MAIIKGETTTLSFTAWNTTTLTRKGGDAANMTAYILIDDAAATTTTNSPVESTVLGEYNIDLTTSETNGEFITVVINSTTANVVIESIRFTTAIDGSLLAEDILDELIADHDTVGSVGEALQIMRQSAVGKKIVTENSATSWTVDIYDTDNATVLVSLDIAVSGSIYTRTVSQEWL